MLAAGRVIMASAPADRVLVTSQRLHRAVGVQWNGALVSVTSWAIASSSRRQTEAAALIAAATRPDLHGALLERIGLGAAGAPAQAGLRFDAGFWRDEGTALGVRFDAWLKG